MLVADSNHKGNVAELAIATEAAKLGLSVLKPLTEHERYDLVLGIADRLLRVQCKWGARKGDVVCVRVSSCYHSPTRGYVKATYDPGEVDLIAVYCGELDSCYLLPASLVAGQGTIHLRLGPARNNQRAALNFAATYEFQGAVAQLEERLTGSQEAEGSSPSSSTPDLRTTIRDSFADRDDFGELEATVGMDEFYAKLAQYVRRAEGGGEVEITRWGRPVARLCPPDLKAIPAPADD